MLLLYIFGCFATGDKNPYFIFTRYFSFRAKLACTQSMGLPVLRTTRYGIVTIRNICLEKTFHSRVECVLHCTNTVRLKRLNLVVVHFLRNRRFQTFQTHSYGTDGIFSLNMYKNTEYNIQFKPRYPLSTINVSIIRVLNILTSK